MTETFNVGDKVVLVADPESGWDEELGTVESVEPKGVYIVKLDSGESIDCLGIYMKLK